MPNEFDLDEFLKLQDPSSFRMMGVTDEAEPNPDMPIPAAPMPMRAPAVAANPPVTPALSPSPGLAPAAGAASAAPSVQDYIKKKFNLGEYSDENRKKLAGEAEAGPGIGTKLAAAAAALGQGLMGGNAAGAGMGILNADAQERQKKLDQFDKGRSNLIQEHTLDRMADKEGREDADLASAMDPNSAVSMSFQSLASKIDPKGDWKNKSAYDIQKTYPQLEKIYGIDQKRIEKLDNRAFQERLFGLKQDERDDARQLKRDERDLQLAVPGYERTGEVLPKPEEAMKLRKATVTADQLQSKLNRLRDLVKDKGSFEYGGQSGAEMESLATEIQLLSKSPEMYELGVLTGPDMNLLQKITADPASMSSFFTRDNTRLKQIDTQLKSVKDKVDSTARSMGYRSANQGSSPVTPSEDPGFLAWKKSKGFK